MTNAERWLKDSFCSCPYCGVIHDVTIDPTEGDEQEFIEDCRICCRPITIKVRFDAHRHEFTVEAFGEDD